MRAKAKPIRRAAMPESRDGAFPRSTPATLVPRPWRIRPGGMGCAPDSRLRTSAPENTYPPADQGRGQFFPDIRRRATNSAAATSPVGELPGTGAITGSISKSLMAKGYKARPRSPGQRGLKRARDLCEHESFSVNRGSTFARIWFSAFEASPQTQCGMKAFLFRPGDCAADGDWLLGARCVLSCLGAVVGPIGKFGARGAPRCERIGDGIWRSLDQAPFGCGDGRVGHCAWRWADAARSPVSYPTMCRPGPAACPRTCRRGRALRAMRSSSPISSGRTRPPAEQRRRGAPGQAAHRPRVRPARRPVPRPWRRPPIPAASRAAPQQFPPAYARPDDPRPTNGGLY